MKESDGARNARRQLARLPDARRARVKVRAAELIAEEMTLRNLRRATAYQRGA
jgi:hypothetical protein